jgi:uncharacterized protein YdeI (YjbR/CyaY-like superfamily)
LTSDTTRDPAASASPRVEVDSPQALDQWLAAHHATARGVWLVTWKKHTGSRYLSTDQVLDALLAWGWIDGRRMKLDDDRTMQWIAPRAQEAWAQTYKDRAARLIAEGRMQPAGLAAMERSRSLGKWDAMAHVDALVVPPDLADALSVVPDAAHFFAHAAPSYRRNVLRWLAGAKRAETRAKRIATIVQTSEGGRKIPQL